MYVPSSASLLRKELPQLQSLDCYQNFVRGWVRQVLVKPIRDKRRLVYANYVQTILEQKYVIHAQHGLV